METPKTANRTYPTARAASGSKSVLERIRAYQDNPVLQRIRPEGMPWACEDEESQIGESTVHTLSAGSLFFGLTFHFARRVSFRVFANLNLYFSPDHPNLFLTPDVMVVKTPQPLPAQLACYGIGEQGPTPLLVGEVLSPRTYHEGDLDRKPIQYGEIGIDEYLIADVTGELLSQRLLLLQRQRDGRWRDAQDTDGGVTSRLGFRVVIGDDGQLRVLDSKTQQPYARPDEAQTAAEELAVEIEVRRRAEERVRALEEELARLRGTTPEAEPQAKKRKGRRRKP